MSAARDQEGAALVLVPVALALAGFLAWLWPASGAPGIRLIKAAFDDDSAGSCKTTSLGETKVVKESGHDLLVVRFANDCAKAVDTKVTLALQAPISCVGQPKDVVPGNTFSTAGGMKAYMVCTVDYSSYKTFKATLRGKTGLPGERSELALEVVP